MYDVEYGGNQQWGRSCQPVDETGRSTKIESRKRWDGMNKRNEAHCKAIWLTMSIEKSSGKKHNGYRIEMMDVVAMRNAVVHFFGC